jgi:hypothetical protein
MGHRISSEPCGSGSCSSQTGSMSILSRKQVYPFSGTIMRFRRVQEVWPRHQLEAMIGHENEAPARPGRDSSGSARHDPGSLHAQEGPLRLLVNHRLHPQNPREEPPPERLHPNQPPRSRGRPGCSQLLTVATGQSATPPTSRLCSVTGDWAALASATSTPRSGGWSTARSNLGGSPPH